MEEKDRSGRQAYEVAVVRVREAWDDAVEFCGWIKLEASCGGGWLLIGWLVGWLVGGGWLVVGG